MIFKTLCMPVVLFFYALDVFGATFEVDTFLDSSSPAHQACSSQVLDDCSLRGAVLRANASAGLDVIVLMDGDYSLTLVGSNEDDAYTGDLDIDDDIEIISRGGSKIEANLLGDRLFDFHGGDKKLSFSLTNIALNSGSSDRGGAVQAVGGTLWFDNVTLADNESSTRGGGLYAELSVLKFRDTAFVRNFALYGGGAYLSGGGADIRRAVYRGNVAELQGGAIHVDESEVIIDDSVFRENQISAPMGSPADGGGAIFNDTGSLELSACTFVNNAAGTLQLSGGRGGAVHSELGSLSMSDTTFRSNTSGYGGGAIYSSGDLDTSMIVVAENVAAQDGGGLYLVGNSDLSGARVLENNGRFGGGIYNIGILSVTDETTVSDNSSSSTGGGIWNSGTLTLSNTNVLRNVATSDSGGIHHQGLTELDVMSSDISDNTSGGTLGGGGIGISGIQTDHTKLTISDSKIINNSTVTNGGGILNANGITRISGSRVEGNSAGNDGGAIYSHNFSTDALLVINYSSISSNVAQNDGGGIYLASSSPAPNLFENRLVMNNSSLSHNNATNRGGGIYLQQGSVLVQQDGAFVLQPVPMIVDLYNVTIADNNASGPGYGLTFVGGELNSSNSIIADQFGGGSDCALGGTVVVSYDYNLESGTGCDFVQQNDQQNTSPQLAALADNGGDTLSHELLLGSPAIDAANPAGCQSDIDGDRLIDMVSLGDDQRGEPRDNLCDIGAYER